MKLQVLVIACMLGMVSGVHAKEVVPILPIETLNDARTHGLEDLRKAKKDIRGPNLNDFLNPGSAAQKALLQLGKIAFWDQQFGSGGRAGDPGQACASCHLHAGADSRNRNAVNPKLTRVKDVNEGRNHRLS